MKEQWIPWALCKDFKTIFALDSITDSQSGFIIELSENDNQNNKLIICFQHSVDSYKKTYESFRQRSYNILQEEKTSDCSFFEIKNSNYIKWLSDESYGITDSLKPKHFVIFAVNSVLDIVSRYDPKIKKL